MIIPSPSYNRSAAEDMENIPKQNWKLPLNESTKLLVLSNSIFCQQVFKKLFAAELSESIYMRKRVNPFQHTTYNESVITEKSWKHCGKRRNCLSWLISSFATMFSYVVCCRGIRMCLYVGKYSGKRRNCIRKCSSCHNIFKMCLL